jgi:hypothetical protein
MLSEPGLESMEFLQRTCFADDMLLLKLDLVDAGARREVPSVARVFDS